jgi:hypothetical protein
MPSSPFATHISTEHLCYENTVRRSSLASDYDVDKRLITCCTSTTSQSWSPTATLAVLSRTRVPSWRGARRPCGIDRETRVANVSPFALFKDSWLRLASFTRKLHCDPETFRVTHREMMRCLNIYLVFHKFDWQNTCVWVTCEPVNRHLECTCDGFGGFGGKQVTLHSKFIVCKDSKCLQNIHV